MIDINGLFASTSVCATEIRLRAQQEIPVVTQLNAMPRCEKVLFIVIDQEYYFRTKRSQEDCLARPICMQHSRQKVLIVRLQSRCAIYQVKLVVWHTECQFGID